MFISFTYEHLWKCYKLQHNCELSDWNLSIFQILAIKKNVVNIKVEINDNNDIVVSLLTTRNLRTHWKPIQLISLRIKSYVREEKYLVKLVITINTHKLDKTWNGERNCWYVSQWQLNLSHVTTLNFIAEMWYKLVLLPNQCKNLIHEVCMFVLILFLRLFLCSVVWKSK